MRADGIPDDVRALIDEHLESVLELDVLLAVTRRRGVTAVTDVARELRMNEPAMAAALDKLAASGLLSRDGDEYTFAPGEPGLAYAVAALEQAYARRRVRVIEAIYAPPA